MHDIENLTMREIKVFEDSKLDFLIIIMTAHTQKDHMQYFLDALASLKPHKWIEFTHFFQTHNRRIQGA